MHQLSAHDTRLLHAESPQANANVTLLHIYDQRTVPGGVLRFKTVLARIESRLDRSPIFRHKLLRVPLALDNPYWVDDEHFDLEYHVRHIALPKPGDWRQFCIQVSRIHARPLDLDRPLWEVYVIEGLDSLLDLPPGSFALLTKTHQVALDIDQGAELTALLHDDRADAPPNPPAAPWFPRKAPSRVKMVTRGLARAVRSPMRLALPVAEAVTRQVAHLAPAMFDWAVEMLGGPKRAFATRFNSVVSAWRVFETRRFSLEDFKTLRTLVDGATVNDCVLAVCGGALRRYLEAHDELPDAPLSAMAPITTRCEGGAPGGDSEREDGADPGATTIALLNLSLASDCADPVERLRRIVEQTAASATVQRAVSARELTDIERHAPAATLAMAGRMLAIANLTQARAAPLAHCTITNVPGSAKPLYLCGARMTWFSAMLPLADGMGLVIAVTSYDGQIIVSPTSCRELMPDPEFFALCVRESFQEMLAAAQQAAALREGHLGRAARVVRAAKAPRGKAAPRRAKRLTSASSSAAKTPASPPA